MEWTSEATEKLQDILCEIPGMVRDMAEDSIRNKAEEKAEDRGSSLVELEDAISGFIVATPYHMRRFLKPTLEKKGIDVSKYSHLLP